MVKYHEQRKTICSVTKETAKFCKELGIPEISIDETEVVTAAPETSKENGKTAWPTKTTTILMMMHWKYPKSLLENDTLWFDSRLVRDNLPICKRSLHFTF